MKRVFTSFAAPFILVAFACVLATPVFSGNRTAEAKSLLAKAMQAYDRKDYGGAKTNLALALEAEPNFAEAYLLKGLIAYRDGQTDKAEEYIKRAADLNPQLPDRIREQLENQAHEVEANLTEQEFSHFMLKFHGANERDKAWTTLKYLDGAYNYLGSRFGVFPANKIQVIIFNTEEFWEAWNAPMWLGGFFDKRDGKVRLRFDDPPGGEEEMQRRVRHEFTHAFVNGLYPKDLPLWFQEGIAQFYAYANPTDSFWKERRLEELRKTMKGAPWLDMDKIQEVIGKKNVSPGIIYLAYLESEAMVLTVAKDRGDSWIPLVIEQLRQGKPFLDAYQAVVGITPAASMEHTRRAIQ